MAKRSRRRPKRAARGELSQLDQKLSKRARELFVSGEGFVDDESELARLHDEYERIERRPPRSPSSAKAERDAEETAGAGTATGTVIGLASGLCRVEEDGPEGRRLDCVLASRLAADQQSAVAVGDRVRFDPPPESGPEDETPGRVHEVLPRRTTLSRPDPLHAHKERVLAANVDVVVHVASLRRPPLRPALVDRFLIAAGRGGADAALAVNKIDLVPPGRREEEMEPLAVHRGLGVPVVAVSARTGEGLDDLRALVAGRTAVFAGHSGVGKSSLLAALHPDLDLAVGEVDGGGGKGRHTTTRSGLYTLPDGGRIIDTPGIREFGLWRMDEDDLVAYFPDLAALGAACRFADCTHVHEPECAVRAAVEARQLPGARYEAYRRLRDALGES